MASQKPPVKRLTAFRLDPALLDALQRIKARDGIGLAEQVRRALAAWVQSKGVRVTAERPATSSRTAPRPSRSA